MKKFLLLLLVLCNTFSFGQTKNEKLKNLISIIYQSYEAGSINSNTYTRLPQEYITKSDGTIIGQKYTYLIGSYDLNDTLLIIDPEKEFPTSAKWNTFEVTLTWDNSNLKNINYKNGSNYTVHQKDGSKIVSFSKNIDDKTNILYSTILNEDGKIEEVMYFSKKSYDNKPKIHGDRIFTYDANKVTVKNIIYKAAVNPSEKDILSTKTSIYTIENNNLFQRKYTVEEKKKNFELNETLQYDELGKLQHKKSISSNDNGNIIFEKYFYIENKLFKTITTIKNQEGKQISTRISINFDNPVQNANLNNYDQKHGNYEFDANDDLIYESDGQKHRKKVNGVWESWQYINY